jgi:hypothetical protein
MRLLGMEGSSARVDGMSDKRPFFERPFRRTESGSI